MTDLKKASLIIIGDEILEGRVQDLHLKWISRWLKNHHINLVESRFIQDQIADITTSVRELSKKSQLIFVTGGLGPTEDDKTKLAFAELLGTNFEEHEKAFLYTSEHYRRINKTWSPKTNSYHLLPKGIEPLKNPSGLAPGLFFEFEQSLIFALPGVPREMKSMVEESIYPLIKNRVSQKESETLVIRTQGIAEEKIFFELCPELWSTLSQYGKVSSLPQTLGVDIIVRLFEAKDKDKLIQECFTDTPLSPYIWQIGNLSLEEFILNRLRKKGQTLSLAESCTGGISASRLTDISGCSDVFLGSAVTYSNFSKENILGVNSSLIQNHGAVSEAVALEMAKGALEKYKSDIALSYSGIAGPTGGSKNKPVGTVCIGVASKSHSQSFSYTLKGSDRLHLKKRFSERGFFTLLNFLNELDNTK